MLDVAEALVMLGLVIYMAARFSRLTPDIREKSYHAYRVMINVILVVLVLFFVVGSRITWTYFLPGIAWRTWLLFYAWPHWVAASRTTSDSNAPAYS